MNDNENYYALIGVEPMAEPEQIKQAYLRSALQCHPDRGGSEAGMLRLAEAWEVLRDRQLRRIYDHHRSTPNDPDVEQQWKEAKTQARARAEGYPRSWFTLEKLLAGVRQDASDVQSERGLQADSVAVEVAPLVPAVHARLAAALGGQDPLPPRTSSTTNISRPPSPSRSLFDDESMGVKVGVCVASFMVVTTFLAARVIGARSEVGAAILVGLWLIAIVLGLCLFFDGRLRARHGSSGWILLAVVLGPAVTGMTYLLVCWGEVWRLRIGYRIIAGFSAACFALMFFDLVLWLLRREGQ